MTVETAQTQVPGQTTKPVDRPPSPGATKLRAWLKHYGIPLHSFYKHRDKMPRTVFLTPGRLYVLDEDDAAWRAQFEQETDTSTDR